MTKAVIRVGAGRCLLHGDRDDAPIGRSAWLKSLREKRSGLAADCRSDEIACNELASADG
jgi:hypothetical protein